MSYINNFDIESLEKEINSLICPDALKNLNLNWLPMAIDKRKLDANLVALKMQMRSYSGITSKEIITECADICINLSSTNPAYAYLGGRLLVSLLHKNTMNTFSEKIKYIANNSEILNERYIKFVEKHSNELDKIIDYNRDYLYDYFGYKTLEKSYMLKVLNKIIERPQDMLMRTAITINIDGDLKAIKELYELMSLGYYTHATPTLFNSGIKSMQLSSCFLLGTEDDLGEISKTWSSCSQISKWAGGIGLHVSNIRGKNALIKGTGGRSNGLVPLMRIFNEVARWVDQGGGKRPGSIAVYLEPHHPDIFEFIDLRKNFGAETERARDLFLALWVSDLFMKQVENDADWYLMSADTCPNLPDVYGEEFEKLYWGYVEKGLYTNKIKARKLWNSIIEAQIETGMPYIAYKDAINKKCNQKNIGTIKSSNLCCEITEYSDSKEYAVCNLASISLKAFVKQFKPNNKFTIYTLPKCKYCDFSKNYLSNNNFDYEIIPWDTQSNLYLKNYLKVDKLTYPQIFMGDTYIGGWTELYRFTRASFDYDNLYNVAYSATLNLNKIIDINYYPVIEAKKSNLSHRPIGLGIQGLADVLVQMRIPFESEEAVEFNFKYMETIYLATMTASNDMAKSRIDGMKILINSKKEFPEYYDKNYIDKDFNELYHSLKPSQCELNKSSNSTTIGAYSTFDGSPLSQGLFQWSLWDISEEDLMYKEQWEKLKQEIIKYGVRNSLTTALMPTASTSQILSNNECFEFFTNNIYTRKTQAGDFMVVNKYLINDLDNIGLWSDSMKNKIIGANGSIQDITMIPQNIKNIYKTVWEIKQIWVLKAAKARGVFVDQTQSMNIFMDVPDYNRLTSCLFWGWKAGLKTGMYYLRSKPATDAIKITVSKEDLIDNISQNSNEGCISCSG